MFALLLVSLLLCLVKASSLGHDNYAWSKNDAERMVRYSYSAYCHKEAILAWDCEFCDSLTSGFTTVHYSYDSSTDTAAFVGYNNNTKEIITSFRGTEPTHIQDWLDDIEFWKADYPVWNISGAKVHSGFYDSYMKHSTDVTSNLLVLMDAFPTYQVFITGHSLGAAMAALLSMDLYYNKAEEIFSRQNPIHSMTFGSPRVGNYEFYKAFEDVRNAIAYYRVTHENDMIPHLPTQSMGFHHLPTEVWETSKGFKICDGAGEDPKCSDSNWTDLSIPDHLSYMNLLFVSCWTEASTATI